ncbi:hypothetical protein M569_09830, partial [Genlisea aurea]
PEDCDFSDEVLKYINHILMEEDVEEKTCMFQESAALLAAEKSLYEVIGQPYQDPSIGNGKFFADSESLHDEYLVSPSSSVAVMDIRDGNRNAYCGNRKFILESSVTASSGDHVTVIDLTLDSPLSTPMNDGKKGSIDSSRGKKNQHYDSSGSEYERSRKQSAIYHESSISPDMFDEVLLCSADRNESAIRQELNSASKTGPKNVHSKDSSNVKNLGHRKKKKKNLVDLNTLLTLCAQSVASGDNKTADELLNQIRQHAAPSGDGMQRLAHYFSNGLEARMAGSGTQIYKSLLNLPISASDILKAYHIYLATCPFRKLSNFFSNKTIMNLSERVDRLHIVDLGILYGFQWPSFLQRLSSRAGGPPKLRITGIDLPCPGFRPAERVEETGKRLARYAKAFKVPFEFHAIAQKWETIRVEDIKIEEDELLVVNCVYRFRNLLDESVVANCPRDRVLNLIREMNPSVLIMGILNGAYNAPFFISRFREALFHYSSVFDMLDANIPREVHERMLLEKTIFGQEAMNVIACEGAERIERPETYKQWQVRSRRAGFEMVALDRDIMQMAKKRVGSLYHKDFVVAEDGRWMLQGWKGRILCGLSCWRPV